MEEALKGSRVAPLRGVRFAPLHGVRFAPSPTGRFHVGNLRTAWISHAIARRLGEPWIVRFEDIDGPRVVAGAQELQLEDMRALGLEVRPELGDELIRQSDAHARHLEWFLRAVRERRVYPCFCSRKDVREALDGAASAPHGRVATYSGRCRERVTAAAAAANIPDHSLPSLAWRFALDEDPSGRSDFIVARTSVELSTESGSDAVLLPSDPASFAPAYHWACAIDDAEGRYRLLVRASDLADVVPQHRAIMRWLGYEELPKVFHTALVTQNDGHRLEKRTQGVTLPELLAAGWSAERIVAKFTESFDPGAHAGEPRERISLRDLGF